MADLSDVEQTIVNTVSSILYPSGSSHASIIGELCRVYRGWPNAAALNSDLNSGTVNITVVADNDSGRITTRYLPNWQTTESEPGIRVNTVNSTTFLISGQPAVGDVVGVLVDRHAYAYRIQIGDTPELVAANLSQLIQNNRNASVVGSVVTIPGVASIQVRAVCDNTSSYESRRQDKDLRIIFWCSSPLVRDAAVSVVDAALNGLNFIYLADDAAARIAYKNTASYDQAQNALLYRRDLIYTVEYPTVTAVHGPSMLFGAVDINGSITFA